MALNERNSLLHSRFLHFSVCVWDTPAAQVRWVRLDPIRRWEA